MIFYQKKELPPPPNKQLTTDETPLRRIKKTATTNPWNRYYWTTHFDTTFELTTKKYRSIYNRLTLYPNLTANVVLQLHEA